MEKSKNIRKVRYEEMLPHEAVAARGARPVAYLPIGTIEWHGEQNCLGLDTVKIHALAMECAKRIGGIVFPSLFYGEPRENYLLEANHDPDGKIAGKMELPRSNFKPGYMGENVYEANIEYVKLIHRILQEIHSLGFNAIVVMAGHYPLLYHARAACELFNLENAPYKPSPAWACTGYELIKDEIPDAGDHAAAWETSLMMALRPDLVDLKRLPKGANKKLIGVWGKDPRKYASAEFGRKGIDAIVKRVDAKVKEMLKGL
ncbi:MAG: creatininase family protein [Candidatus Omnitrophica bacterium]|nr:creatininase family protein [Candidatus Omnitrophota bacterium]